MADDREVIEAHMTHVRESLHDLRDQLGGVQLLQLELQSIKTDIKAIDADLKQLAALSKVVVGNREDILKVKTVGGFLGTLFSVLLTILAVFKGK